MMSAGRVRKLSHIGLFPTILGNEKRSQDGNCHRQLRAPRSGRAALHINTSDKKDAEMSWDSGCGCGSMPCVIGQEPVLR